MKEDGNGILFQKLFQRLRKDFENPGQKPNNVQKSAEQFYSQKGRKYFENKYFFNFLLDVSKEEARSKVTIGTNNCDVKTYRNYLGICQPYIPK